MTEFKRTLEEWFNLLNEHKKAIAVCEIKAGDIIDDYILEFFEAKGLKFELVNNKWDPINRYHLPQLPYPDFKSNHAPTYYIHPYTLLVTFKWWKNKNSNPTKVVWDPREETIKDLYDKKLKKVFKLI